MRVAVGVGVGVGVAVGVMVGVGVRVAVGVGVGVGVAVGVMVGVGVRVAVGVGVGVAVASSPPHAARMIASAKIAANTTDLIPLLTSTSSTWQCCTLYVLAIPQMAPLSKGSKKCIEYCKGFS